jgi:hypothetical protein
LAPALDLIGADAAEVLQLKARVAEMESALSDKESEFAQTLSAKEKELTDLQQKVTAMRETGLGTFFDELASLRTQAADHDRLKAENQRYRQSLEAVRDLVIDFTSLPKKVLPAVTEVAMEPKKKRRKQRRTPESLAAKRANLAKAHEAMRRRKAERQALDLKAQEEINRKAAKHRFAEGGLQTVMACI